MRKVPSNSKVNYWKISSITLLLIISTSGIVMFYSINKPKRAFTMPEDNSSTQEPQSTYTYPSNTFWLTRGDTAIISNDVLKDKYFTISLKPYPIGNVTVPEKQYKIPLSNIDYISDPKISHNEKYGCVTVGSSGYSGYYIFTLPNGNKVDQGIQYSQCVEWINDHQVIIVENKYNTDDISYYIFDAVDKSKKILSKFSNPEF